MFRYPRTGSRFVFSWSQARETVVGVPSSSSTWAPMKRSVRSWGRRLVGRITRQASSRLRRCHTVRKGRPAALMSRTLLRDRGTFRRRRTTRALGIFHPGRRRILSIRRIWIERQRQRGRQALGRAIFRTARGHSLTFAYLRGAAPSRHLRENSLRV